MMEEINTIIPDFINIKLDIDKTSNSYPKIIGLLYNITIGKYYKNKLIKILKRMTNPDVTIINGTILDEFMTYLFSSFPPNGNYKDIKSVNVIYPDSNSIYHITNSIVNLSNENIAVIKYNQKEDIINIEFKIKNIDKRSNIDYTYLSYSGNKLYQENDGSNITYGYIKELNDTIITNIQMYILEYILEEDIMNEKFKQLYKHF